VVRPRRTRCSTRPRGYRHRALPRVLTARPFTDRIAWVLPSGSNRAPGAWAVTLDEEQDVRLGFAEHDCFVEGIGDTGGADLPHFCRG
jgi:hypothetical protein